MLAELVVSWEDYVANIQTMSRDMIKLQLSQHLSRNKNILSRDMSFMSRRSDIVVTFIHLESCNRLTTFTVLRHTTIFSVVWYIMKQLFYETAWSVPFWNHNNDVTSLVKVHTEYSPAARVLHTKFD